MECRKGEHKWSQCKCEICGIVRNEDHELDECVCSVCGLEFHDWTAAGGGEDYYMGFAMWCKKCQKKGMAWNGTSLDDMPKEEKLYDKKCAEGYAFYKE